jgi:hypothetical protein
MKMLRAHADELAPHAAKLKNTLKSVRVKRTLCQPLPIAFYFLHNIV